MLQDDLDMIDKVLISGNFDKCHNHPYGKAGTCFSLRRKEIHSNYWVYHCDDMFTITISDILAMKDISFNYEQTEYISLYYYDSIKTIPLNDNPPLVSGRVAAYISCGENYTLTYCKGTPLRGVAVNIMPAYYEKRLKHWIPGGFERLKKAFAALNGREVSSEVLLVLRQLQNSKISGDIARLYYESKVNELISIVLSYEESSFSYDVLYIDEEKELLKEISECIHKYYASDISLSQLAVRGNMSVSKLKYIFKKLYGCTVNEYIINLRLEEAKKILESGENSIADVARLVGYKKAGSFSRMFKRETGMLPREYRKSSRGVQQD